jgi:hypothetical protein
MPVVLSASSLMQEGLALRKEVGGTDLQPIHWVAVGKLVPQVEELRQAPRMTMESKPIHNHKVLHSAQMQHTHWAGCHPPANLRVVAEDLLACRARSAEKP